MLVSFNPSSHHAGRCNSPRRRIASMHRLTRRSCFACLGQPAANPSCPGTQRPGQTHRQDQFGNRRLASGMLNAPRWQSRSTLDCDAKQRCLGAPKGRGAICCRAEEAVVVQGAERSVRAGVSSPHTRLCDNGILLTYDFIIASSKLHGIRSCIPPTLSPPLITCSPSASRRMSSSPCATSRTARRCRTCTPSLRTFLPWLGSWRRHRIGPTS